MRSSRTLELCPPEKATKAYLSTSDVMITVNNVLTPSHLVEQVLIFQK